MKKYFVANRMFLEKQEAIEEANNLNAIVTDVDGFVIYIPNDVTITIV